MTIAVGTTVMASGEVLRGETVEMVASRHPRPEEMEAYERVLGDAMAGDATLFAREDYVEEAWRIVDPVLKADTAIYQYEKGTWGPEEVEKRVSPPGGWHNRQKRTRKTSALPPKSPDQAIARSRLLVSEVSVAELSRSGEPHEVRSI